MGRLSVAPENHLILLRWSLIGLLVLLVSCSGPAVDTAGRLEATADSLYAVGDFPEADAAYAELVEIRQSEADARPLPLARALLGRARSAYGLRLIEVAAPAAQRALEIRRRELGSDHADVADALYWLALIEFYRLTGAEAGERVGAMLRECERIRRRVLGDEHRLVLKTRVARAVYDPQIRFDIGKAELLLRDVLEDQRRLLGPDHVDQVETLDRLSGRLTWYLAEHHEAYELAQQAIAIQRRHNPHHTDMAEVLNTAAMICRTALGCYEEAHRLYDEAYAIRSRIFGPDHVETITIQANRAPLFAHEGDPEKAERLLVEVLEAAARAEQSGQNVAPLLSNINLKRVQIAERSGNFALAERLQLARTASKWVPPTSIGHLRNNELIGRAKAGQGDLTGALEYFDETIRLFEAGRTVRGSGIRAATYATTPYEYRALVSLETGKFEDAWHDLEMARARLLAESLAGGAHAPVGLREVQSTLSPSTAIVGWLDHELFSGGSRSWAYVIRDTEPVRWERLPREPDEDLAALQFRYGEFRDALVAEQQAAFGSIEHEFEPQASKELWLERFGPVEKHLEGVTELVVIPSPAMGGLPVGVLMDPQERFVLERWNLAYAPSATVRARLLQGRGPEGRRRTGLLVGDPPFREVHLAATELPDPASAGRPTRATVRRALDGDRDALTSLPRLPWTRTEVESIAPFFADPLVLLGARASEQAFLDLVADDRMVSFDVLHLATHGFVNEISPGRSALVLSQVPLSTGSPDESADGLLQADEIARYWHLDASLVTLSACDTGLGRRIFGEGTVGFAHPLIQAGARSVLASLWSVDDESGALLMNRFYGNWLGPASSDLPRMTKAAALREAQLWVREWQDADGRRPYAHPYFWSGFILVGDSR
jgi:CHAT domain-containing protein/tetratricopeptide (TPR) repeat protein